MRTKKNIWFWPTDVQHICVTVRLPPALLIRGHALSHSRRRAGRPGRICCTLCRVCSGTPSLAKSPRTLKGSRNDDPNGGGVAVLATSPRVWSRMHDACYANNTEQRLQRGRKTDQPTKKDQEKKTQNRKKQRKGLGANPGHK